MGLGAALGERVAYRDDGVPAATTFAEYVMPRAGDLPEIRLSHRETPSPYTLLGTEGLWRGWPRRSPGRLRQRCRDAIAPLGGRVEALPMSPPAVLEAIDRRAR